MIEIKTVYPYIDNNSLVYHYAEDETGKRFCIKQLETDLIYAEAVDVYPCRYTYEVTDIEVTVYIGSEHYNTEPAIEEVE